MPFLEVACFTPGSALVPQAAGADRIELCVDKDAGGTTPPMEDLLRLKTINIPIYVMIRPRGGDFVFSQPDFEQMKADIARFKPLVQGFVLGILDSSHKVDVLRTADLVSRAAPLPCTFHRAFDETNDPLAALEDVIASGCSAVLTSGGAAEASLGADLLAQLVGRAGGRIQILVGGGVRASNIDTLRTTTRAEGFHSSGIVDQGLVPDADEIRRMNVLLQRPVVHSTS